MNRSTIDETAVTFLDILAVGPRELHEQGARERFELGREPALLWRRVIDDPQFEKAYKKELRYRRALRSLRNWQRQHGSATLVCCDIGCDRHARHVLAEVGNTPEGGPAVGSHKSLVAEVRASRDVGALHG